MRNARGLAVAVRSELPIPISILRSDPKRLRLPAISQQMIEDTLHLLGRYMNKVAAHYRKEGALYQHGIELKRDADAVVEMLKFGFRFRELLKDGKIPLDEARKSTWSDA